jgi:hypothetical protein
VAISKPISLSSLEIGVNPVIRRRCPKLIDEINFTRNKQRGKALQLGLKFENFSALIN